MSINDNIKVLENIKQGFKKTISWNKCRSQITQPESNNLDYMIDPTFRNINRLVVLSLKRGDNYLTRNYFVKYYIPLVEIKGFNALINKNLFFDHSTKSKAETYEKSLKYQETIIIQEETYYILCTIKIIIYPLVFIYQHKIIKAFLKTFIL